MPDLVQGVTQLVRAMAPSYEYRWTDALIGHATHLADLAVCEAAEALWDTHDITLVAGQSTYDLPLDVVWIKNVQYCRDGVNFEVVLNPAVPQDFDRMSNRWQDDTGYPSHYALLSVTGVADYSKIILWRKLASVSGEMIRLNYLSTRSSASETLTSEMPQQAIQSVYLPYVLALLRAGEEPEEAEGLMQQYRQGMQRVRRFYGLREGEPTVGMEVKP